MSQWLHHYCDHGIRISHWYPDEKRTEHFLTGFASWKDTNSITLLKQDQMTVGIRWEFTNMLGNHVVEDYLLDEKTSLVEQVEAWSNRVSEYNSQFQNYDSYSS
jgi:hypothetical protein